MKSLPFYYGWVIVFVAALVQFASAPGQTYVVSIFIEPMITEMGWSRTLFSSMYAIASLSAALFMIVVGRSLDRFGTRRTLTTLIVLMGLATIWMSAMDSEWKLVIGFASIRAIGQGSLGRLVGPTMISTWFIRMRGRANSISSVGGALSMAVFPLLVHMFISEFGWRMSWLILGFSVWALLLLPSVILVRRNPEEVGLLPDGIPNSNRPQNASGLSMDIEVNFSMREALQTRALWMLTLSGVSMPLIMTGLMFHHVSVLDSKGLSPWFAAMTMGLFGPMTLIFNVCCGFLVDKFANRFLLTAGNAILIITMLCLMWTSDTWQAIIYIVLLSASGSLIYTTNTVVWANYFGRLGLGTITGFNTTMMVAFSALGAIPFGLIHDQTGSYDKALVMLIAMPAGSLLCALLATPPKKRLATLNK